MDDERYVFIDADSILYRSTYGQVSDSDMKRRYRDRLDYIKINTFATDMFVAVKGFDNFRDKIDPMYKKNRKPLDDLTKRKLSTLHEYALELGAFRADGWEADDQVRAWAHETQEDGIPWIIAGIDKDLLQIPGTHFNYGGTHKKPLTEDQKWKFITQEEGDFRMACQLLTGDTIDNIYGIKGIGPAKSKKLLENKNRKQMMNEIINLYKKEYPQWEDKLKVNSNLIYMRRWPDDEFDYKEWLNG